VSPHPNRRELDMLLTAGERISMSLMSMALSDLDVPRLVLPAVKPGCDRRIPFLRAHFRVRPFAYAKNSIADASWFLAGFQGVNPVTKEITTLGRGAATPLRSPWPGAKSQVL